MDRGQGRYVRFSMSEATTFCNGNPSEIALRASFPTEEVCQISRHVYTSDREEGDYEQQQANSR